VPVPAFGLPMRLHVHGTNFHAGDGTFAMEGKKALG
jgi:hypothetical protein